MVLNSVLTSWMWVNIIGPHIAKGPMGPISKNQLNRLKWVVKHCKKWRNE